MFSILGIPVLGEGRRYERITWDEGELRGPAWLVAQALADFRRYEGMPLGPAEGPVTNRGHLKTPISASIILAGMFLPDSIIWGGDVPQRPEIPEGAIG